ncbi:MAG: hypothetical protein COB00_07950 [Alcanivorax sp.]|nr:MAG: hypothetical protein COB00_07950 [Alcanivorax sp.]
MGEDGAIGAKKIKAKGGHVIAQNEESCVVYGMPRVVIEQGTADAVLSPEDIRTALHRICSTHAGGHSDHLEDRIVA